MLYNAKNNIIKGYKKTIIIKKERKLKDIERNIKMLKYHDKRVIILYFETMV